jgi:hypothetical protein
LNKSEKSESDWYIGNKINAKSLPNSIYINLYICSITWNQ